MHPIQDLFLESFSYVLQFDMHFYMHSCVDKKFYSCKKWVLHRRVWDGREYVVHDEAPGKQWMTWRVVGARLGVVLAAPVGAPQGGQEAVDSQS
jgi:hypothetical protein